MEAASSYLALMPINKYQIATFSEKLISEVTSGFTDPIEVAVQFKAMEKVIETVRKDKRVQSEIMAVVEKNKNKIEFQGATIEIRNKAKYHYEQDSVWSEMNAELEAVKAKMKEREALLKTLKQELADPVTGEIIAPIQVDNEETLFVSFKK